MHYNCRYFARVSRFSLSLVESVHLTLPKVCSGVEMSRRKLSQWAYDYCWSVSRWQLSSAFLFFQVKSSASTQSPVIRLFYVTSDHVSEKSQEEERRRGESEKKHTDIIHDIKCISPWKQCNLHKKLAKSIEASSEKTARVKKKKKGIINPTLNYTWDSCYMFTLFLLS